jgi:hypothetical protein
MLVLRRELRVTVERRLLDLDRRVAYSGFVEVALREALAGDPGGLVERRRDRPVISCQLCGNSGFCSLQRLASSSTRYRPNIDSPDEHSIVVDAEADGYWIRQQLSRYAAFPSRSVLPTAITKKKPV